MGFRERKEKAQSILGLGLSLAKANFKVRNEGSYLGIFWYLLEPLLMFVILILLQRIIGNEIPEYPLYLLMGLIMFNFFFGFTMNSINTIKNNRKVIKSVKVSYESFISSSLLQSLFSHIFEIIILIIFFLYYDHELFNLVFYPIIFVFLVMFSLGVSLILATLGVYVNDLNNVWRVVTRLLWFATPIFYMISESSELYRFVLLNPLYYFITISRDLTIYNKLPESFLIYVMLGLSIFVLIVGLWIFNKYKSRFAEVN